MSAGPFDAAAVVADMEAAGLVLWIMREVPRGGEMAGPPSYFLRSQSGQDEGRDGYDAVVARWRDAMVEHPDFAERVAAYLGEVAT